MDIKYKYLSQSYLNKGEIKNLKLNDSDYKVYITQVYITQTVCSCILYCT